MTTTWRVTFVALLLLLCGLTTTVSGQQPSVPIPGVTITCANEESTLVLQPTSGSAAGTAVCTVENPSSFIEEIDFEYDGDSVTLVGPESMSLGAGAEESITIIVRSDSLNPTLRNSTVTATVTSVQGGEWPSFLEQFSPSDESTILSQVDEFVDLGVTVSPEIVILSSELMQPMTATLRVSNDGNIDDNVEVEIQNSAALSDRSIEWNVTTSGDSTIPADGGSATFDIRFIPNPSMNDETFDLNIRIISSSGSSNNANLALTVNTSAPEESILDITAMNIPSWAYIAGGTLGILFVLAAALSISKRLRGNKGEYIEQEDFEDDVDLDDLDDLDDFGEDDLLDDLDDLDFADLD